MVEGTASQREWIARVLGVTVPAAPPAKATATSARPAAEPATVLTKTLLADIARIIPDDAAALPAALAEIMPRLVQAATAEPAMDTPALRAGDALGPQDQLLDLVDALKAVMRSARKRETLRAKAETGDATPDEDDATRNAAISEEKRYQTLLDALMSAARGVKLAAA